MLDEKESYKECVCDRGRERGGWERGETEREMEEEWKLWYPAVLSEREV